MMNQQQAAKALQDMLTAYRHLNGRGGAAIRAQHGLYMDDDRNVVKGRNLKCFNRQRFTFGLLLCSLATTQYSASATLYAEPVWARIETYARKETGRGAIALISSSTRED